MVNQMVAPPTLREQTLQMSIADPVERILPHPVQKRKEEVPQIKELQITLPSKSERIRGTIYQRTGISIPSFQELKETFSPKQFARIPEYAGNAAIMVSESIGIPEIKIDEVAKVEKIQPRGGTTFNPIEKKRIDQPGFEYGFQKVDLDLVSPERIGKTIEFGTYLTPLAYPALSGQVVTGIQNYKKEIPSTQKIIEEQTKELSSKEREAYLKTEEGKKFKEDVEKYREDLEKQRRLELLSVGVAGLGLLAPLGGRGLRYAKEEQVLWKAAKPKNIQLFEAVATPTDEGAMGIALVGDASPGRLVLKQRRYEGWLGKPAELSLLEEPSFRVSVVPYRITEEGKAGVVISQNVGKKTTLKTYDFIFGKEMAAPKDFNEMSSFLKFIAKELPPRAVGENVKMTTEVGRAIRIGRKSANQAELFIPSKVPSLKESPLQLSITRATDIPVNGREGRLFFVETATKKTKSTMPRRSGNIDILTGKVYVTEPSLKRGAGEVITKGTQKKLLSQKQIAEQVGGLIAKTPKPSAKKVISNIKVETSFADTLPSITRPSKSLFEGTGQYERTEEVSTRLKSPASLDIKQSMATIEQPTQSFTPLSFDIQSERQDEVQRERDSTVQINIFKERTDTTPIFNQPTRQREETIQIQPAGQDNILRLRLETKQDVLRPTPNRTKKETPSRSPPKITVKYPPAKLFGLPKEKEETKKSIEELFEAFVRKGGKDVKIGEFGTLKEAESSLFKNIRQNIRASGIVTKGGEKVKLNLFGTEFTRSKKDSFRIVEPRSRRIKKGTSELTQLKQARKSKGGFFR